MQYLFVNDIEQLFGNIADDKAIARLFTYKETLGLRDLYNVAPIKGYTPESTYIGLIRDAMQTVSLEPPMDTEPDIRPCAGCVLTGKRWTAADSGLPIYGQYDNESLAQLHPQLPEATQTLLSYITATYGIKFEPQLPGKVPDWTLSAENIDGIGGTLGVTISYVSDNDDIDVGRDRFISVQVKLDSSENYTLDEWITILAHELYHLLGIDHEPEGMIIKGIMAQYYQGAMTTDQHGQWVHNQMIDRYIGRLPA